MPLLSRRFVSIRANSASTRSVRPFTRQCWRTKASSSRDDGDAKPSETTGRQYGLLSPPPQGEARAAVEQWLSPPEEELPEGFDMPIWDHLEELRERVLVGALAAGVAVLTCFAFSKDLVVFLEAPVASQGVRFLQLSPGEFFFTTLKVGGYSGMLLAVPTVLYEIIAYVVPGLTKSERRFLAPIIFGSSILFYLGLIFSYEVLTPAALNFFVSYADGAVESLWSIDQYFEFVLVLMLSTGLSFQVPVIQIMLGQLGIVTSEAMFRQWRFVVVGATIAAAVLTPSTDPFTQTLLAGPLVGLYMGGAAVVRILEQRKLLSANSSG
jgi:sec-independent protein translocase protein TatC